jgi:hypothetical protein
VMAEILPMDHVRLPDGSEAYVNSAHYFDYEAEPPRQMFSICPPGGVGPYPGPLFYADECLLIHRHDFKPYGPIRRCECGEVYTTLADVMAPREDVTWQ